MKTQLSRLDFFSGVSPQTLDQVVQMGSVLNLSKGELLIRAREPVNSIFVQLSGMSAIYNLTHCGKRKILFVFGKGTLLNEHVFSNYTSSVYCEILEKSTILEISATEFQRLMAADFVLTQKVIQAQEKKMWRLSHQLKNTMSHIYLEKKLASKLWKLARDFGVQTEDGIEINMNLTITFLADMMGVPRETTSRTCSLLIEYGLIKMNKKRITIVDPEKMSVFYKTGKIE